MPARPTGSGRGWSPPQLQANGLNGLVDVGGDAPVFITLQSRRGVNPLDPAPGLR